MECPPRAASGNDCALCRLQSYARVTGYRTEAETKVVVGSETLCSHFKGKAAAPTVGTRHAHQRRRMSRQVVRDWADKALRDVSACLDISEEGPTVLRSCTPCRGAKVRCTGVPDARCPRCILKDIECEYPVQRKLGRKVKSP